MEPKWKLTDVQRMYLIRGLTYGDCDETTLLDFKDYYAQGNPPARMPVSEPVMLLWKDGHKIAAIRLHREQCKPNGETRGLKDAKNDCEAIQ